MADAEPSRAPINTAAASASRHWRIQFSDQDHSGPPLPDAPINRFPVTVTSGTSKQSSLSVPKTRSHHARRGYPLRLPDTTDVFSDHYSPKPPRQGITKGLSRTGGKLEFTQDLTEKGKGILELETYPEDSGEYQRLFDKNDLAHDDPRILQDVQRALKLKARREVRNKAGQSPSRTDAVPTSDVASGSSVSSSSSPRPMSFPPSTAVMLPPLRKKEAEVDFSPSTGLAMSVPLHPVPYLSTDGKSLDWTGTLSDDEKSERRWTLSISKRKDKESVPVLSKIALEESHYAKKIGRIKAQASPPTLRKAMITSEQLRRRYSVLYGSLSPGSKRLNIASAARWYGDLDGLVRTSMEKAEPFTWLKHLDRPGTKPSTRLMWHLSALIIEEYCRCHAARVKVKSSSDRQPPVEPSTEIPLLAPDFASPTHTSLRQSLESPISRNRSFEDLVSFEPVAESARNSLEGDHIEGPKVHTFWSLGPTESARNSTYSMLSGSSPQKPLIMSSPASSYLHIRGDMTRTVPLGPNGSDEALSSTRNSISDPSESDGKRVRNSKRQTHLQSDRGASDLGTKFIISGESSPTESGRPPGATFHNVHAITDSEPVNHRSADHISQPLSSQDSHRALGRRRVRTSLRSTDQLAVLSEQLRQQEVDEEKASHEYELKARVLDDAMTHNHTIRQLLHRVAAGVREYDTIQANLMKSLGVPYKNLPQELLDAFSHDPAAVVGATRRFRGWRAVEDTHDRLVQQRDAFQNFLSVTVNTGIFPASGSVLHQPIASLLQSLQALDSHQQEIAIKAAEVAEVLAKVKTTHAVVKTQYNDTLSHTSVVYPELSHIVALEEKYKDQYQQFWELGMDALTFLLDTVTPFWRNYGKIIGKDVQDFLIVPLYRNEFTGEAKRYPIERFPRRSIRHWLGLLLFFVLAVAVTFLQARAALTSIIHFRLRGIITHSGLRWLILPFFWISIIIQSAAVFTEFCIVIAQLGVVTWWIGWSVNLVN